MTVSLMSWLTVNARYFGVQFETFVKGRDCFIYIVHGIKHDAKFSLAIAQHVESAPSRFGIICDSKTMPKRVDGILEILFYPVFVKSVWQNYTKAPQHISFTLRDGTADVKKFSVWINEFVKQPAVRSSGNGFHSPECVNENCEKWDMDWIVDGKA